MRMKVRRAERTRWRSAAWQLAVGTRRVAWGRPTAAWRALPDVLLIGAQRAGTTSLFRYLLDHPDVRWPSLVKGPHWFDVHYDRSARWYRSHFPLATGDEQRDWITGEACPYYLFHPAVPERVARHLPEVRVVAILRDPVARAWSHYQHEVARGNENLSFAAAIEAEPDRLAPELPHLAEPSFVGPHHRHHSYVARGRYAEQLERWFDHVDRQRVLVLFSDELKYDTAATFGRVCRFLGLSPIELDATPRHNARAYDPLDPGLERRLRAAFRDSDERLVDLLGRDLGWSA